MAAHRISEFAKELPFKPIQRAALRAVNSDGDFVIERIQLCVCMRPLWRRGTRDDSMTATCWASTRSVTLRAGSVSAGNIIYDGSGLAAAVAIGAFSVACISNNLHTGTIGAFSLHNVP